MMGGCAEQSTGVLFSLIFNDIKGDARLVPFQKNKTKKTGKHQGEITEPKLPSGQCKKLQEVFHLPAKQYLLS